MAAEKYQQGYPLAPASAMPRSDEETAAFRSINSDERKKKKRMKCLASIAIFAVLLGIIIAAVVLIFLRVRTPKVRLGDVSVMSSTNSSNGGDIRFSARVIVRNRNFGRYKFDDTIANIRSGGETVGQFIIPEARARARSTRRIYVIANINASSRNNVSGVLPLTVEARLRGRIRNIWVIRRRRSADLNCRMSINLGTNAVQDLNCD